MCEYCYKATWECPELLDRHTHIYERCSTIERKERGKGYVYFFSDTKFTKIKIGYTKTRPYTRMEEFEGRHNEKYVMLAIWPVYHRYTEKRIHKRFAEFRIEKNHEWFYYDLRICNFLKNIWRQFNAMSDYSDINEMWGLE